MAGRHSTPVEIDQLRGRVCFVSRIGASPRLPQHGILQKDPQGSLAGPHVRNTHPGKKEQGHGKWAPRPFLERSNREGLPYNGFKEIVLREGREEVEWQGRSWLPAPGLLSGENRRSFNHRFINQAAILRFRSKIIFSVRFFRNPRDRLTLLSM